MSAFLEGTHIEIINPGAERGGFRSVLFDFDGTISLLRQGWQQVMIPMMVQVLAATPRAESEAELERIVTEFVARTTGKQTIYQMIHLAEEVARRGGVPEPPLAYKRLYNDLLMERIRWRIEGVEQGRIEPETMLVPGAKEILAKLRERGCTLYCASGTDETYMRREAELLGVAEYFNGGLYGAIDEYQNFSKKILIQRILRKHELAGRELLAFGDGFVEIENTKQVGGTAVGVASNEATREGIDAWKRRRLIQAGADVIIGDYREHDALLAWLFAEP